MRLSAGGGRRRSAREPPAAMRPRLTWLFDLDNTLHDALPAIMPRINRDMNTYVARTLALSDEAATEVRMGYWRRYGATLLGMIRHHRIDPHEFLRDTHRFPDMQRLVRRAGQLAAVMRRLPGRRLVVTNAPRHYARAVLVALGLAPMLHGLVSIEDMTFAGRWQPKPSAAMLRRLAARHRLVPARCVMVEDTPDNLVAARSVRMATVLVRGWAWRGKAGRRPLAGRGRRIDFQIQSVLTLPRIALR